MGDPWKGASTSWERGEPKGNFGAGHASSLHVALFRVP